MEPEPCIAPPMPVTQARRVVLWLMTIVLAALVAYFGILGYLSPGMLLNYAGSFIC